MGFFEQRIKCAGDAEKSLAAICADGGQRNAALKAIVLDDKDIILP